jgi:hypothetical protein
MRRTVLSGVLTASWLVIAAVSSAHAGSSSIGIAKIPFAFSVGTVTLPAGEYTIRANASGLIMIQGTGSDQSMSYTYPGTSPKNDDRLRLVFHRYDDQYFLSEVFNGTDNPGRKLPVSKLEKEHMRTGSHQVAADSRRPDAVVLAATR